LLLLDLTVALDRIKELAITTGKMQLANQMREDLQMEMKSTPIDLVTEIDKKSEQAITAFIRRHYPTHAILAEESGEISGTEPEYQWVIDPLDGTVNYAHRLPLFAISIALRHQGETVLGVVYIPVLEEMFSAIRGKGAYRNGKPIHVAGKRQLIESVVATGFPYDIAANPINNLRYFNAIILKARGVRRMGVAAYDLACVAAGAFDGYWELNLLPWDIAAGILLVEEAGGKVIHFRQDRGLSIIAGNAIIADTLHETIRGVAD
jgi:myo-inositol-1(or 4)-monophosphatase